MRDFAIVTCLKNIEVSVKKPNIFERIIKYLKNMFNKRKIEEGLTKGIKKVELFKAVGEDGSDEPETALCVHLIKLPLELSGIEASSRSKINKIESFIDGYCISNNINMVIAPKLILEKKIFHKLTQNQFTGRILFKALFLNILDEIYAKRGIKIRDLDIAIVQGKSVQELFSFVRVLATDIKYLTIISEDKGSVEKQAENFFEETGLCIRITNDYKMALKGVNLIINLGNFIPQMKINPHAVILNYGDNNSDKFTGENTLINGVDVRLPVNIAAKLGKEILEYFTNQELSELLLLRKLGIVNEPDSPIDLAGVNTRISKEFIKESFCISGFIGRRSILKVKDIKVYKDHDSSVSIGGRK